MKSKVSIVKCRRYNPDEVYSAVRRAFDLLGGLSSFIKKGEKVVIKPNMLSGRPPEAGVNTHIEVVRAVARLLKDLGAFPVIGDNPGGSLKAKDAYESSGMLSVAKELGIECLDSRDVKIVRGLPISAYFFDCDKIISLPKMKTHSLMCITGAIKNMFGVVAGLNKSECHRRFPRPEEFINVVLDAFEIVRPHLVLMDGIIAMDGDGPASGRLRETGLLVASSDSVAVDSVFLKLVGVNPGDDLTTREASKRGLGEIDLNEIDFLGDGLKENSIKDFKLPPSKFYMNLPSGVIKILTRFIKFGPYINKGICKKCRICAESCPVDAISVTDTKSLIDRRKCIRCMCCHEVCPHNAVELERSILARVFGL